MYGDYDEYDEAYDDVVFYAYENDANDIMASRRNGRIVVQFSMSSIRKSRGSGGMMEDALRGVCMCSRAAEDHQTTGGGVGELVGALRCRLNKARRVRWWKPFLQSRLVGG